MSTPNLWYQGVISAGTTTGGTVGPSIPAQQSTTTGAPVLGPIVPNPYGLPDFPVTTDDFDASLYVSATVNGQLFKSYISPFLCALPGIAFELTARLMQLPGIKVQVTMADPDPQSPGSPFKSSGMVPAIVFLTPSGAVIETALAGDILVMYLRFPSYFADEEVVQAYGPSGAAAKAKGLA